MPRSLSLLLVLAGVWIALAGCTSAPKVPRDGRFEAPASTQSETVRVKVKLFNEVVLHLPPIAAPGDQWAIALNDVRFLKQLGEITPAANGESVVSFHAIRPGRRTIRFLALAPGAREATPSQRYNVIVEIE